jgi:hypothetical protein
MRDIKCKFCKKFVRKVNKNGRCEICDQQYQVVFDKVFDKFGGVIKRLADR